MTHIILGTKAQLIKMAPIMKGLNSRGIAYNYIFTGQHKDGMDEIGKNFGIKSPDHTLYSGKDVSSSISVVPWVLTTLITSWIKRKDIFGARHVDDIVLVHGDTFSTLLGALIGRLMRIRVAHVESGLRSFDFFNPFPEEFNRIITFWFSSVFFCPGEEAIRNISKYKGEKINIGMNTIYDALNYAAEKSQGQSTAIPDEKFAIVSIHRFENLFKKKKLREIVKILNTISQKMKLLFILHEPTHRRLKAMNLLSDFNENITLQSRLDFFGFNTLLKKCEFIITDGGSNQEECAYLGIPCLLMRQATERNDGIGRNIVLSKYNKEVITSFVDHYSDYRTGPLSGRSPSAKIIEYLLRNAKATDNQ